MQWSPQVSQTILQILLEFSILGLLNSWNDSTPSTQKPLWNSVRRMENYVHTLGNVSKKIAETLLRQLLTSPSAGNGRFWQQNVIQDRKSSITQSKLMIFWWNKKFLKAYDLLLLSPEKKIELDFGHGLCWPSFCPNRVLKEQFVKALAVFFQNYNIVT